MVPSWYTIEDIWIGPFLRIKKCNTMTFSISILILRNGPIQISSMVYQDGTIVEYLLKQSQLGNSSYSEESKLNIMKEVQELLENMSIQVAILISEQ
jgi:hypothetical protein